ncbi:MAG: VWA domain-containing protein, partial [Bryobacteraceae bacterium]
QAGGEMQARSTNPMTFDGMRGFDDVDLEAVSNTQAALGELAHATGGFSVANTNEIAKPMQRVMEDIRTHYEISYTPSSDNYDGHFRKISVKIADRSKLRVQTRAGYYALPDLNGQPIEPFEMAALKAVRARPLPQAVAYQAVLMQFRPGPNGSECELGFDIPISGLKIVSDAKTGQAHIHTSVFALIHDAKGQIVGKISRDLAREAPISAIAKLRRQTITYIQPVELPAGHYTIDTAIVDQQASKTSAKRIAVFVNAPNDIALSSITVVKQLEPLKSGRDPLNPFDLANGQILPAVDNRVPGSKPADVYFVVYPAKTGGAAKPTAIVQLFEDGAEIARQTPALPASGQDGSIPVLAQLSLKPGRYQIRVTVQQGSSAAQSSSALTVE